jgi:YD repeat-containing protein
MDTSRKSYHAVVSDTAGVSALSYGIKPPLTATVTSGLTTAVVINGITYTYTYNVSGMVTSFTDGTSTWTVTYDSAFNITAVTKI